MALPNNASKLGMDYELNALPYVDIPAKSSVNTLTMDYQFNALPFVTNPFGVTGPANLKTWCGVSAANIKTINGVPIANVKTIVGL